jgi:uncharacterized protein (DUF362 family)
MRRREFLGTLLGGTITAKMAAAGTIPNRFSPAAPPPFDLVAVKGGEPNVMFDRAIESLGGMKAFVSRGQKVLVKPNIGWDVLPEFGGNTHPALVKRVIEHCYDAGAKKVFVFDHTCDNWMQTYKSSGIESAAQDAGATVVSGDNEGYYQEVTVAKGKVLTKTKVHEILLDCDVFINLPVLKHHSSAKITIGLKNLMGVVWDRRFWHHNDLHQCIADFAPYRLPDLTIVDAYYVMKRNGPRGTSKEDVLKLKSLIASPDMLAADVAATRLFGMKPEDVPYLKYAIESKIGKANLEELAIKRIKL